MNSVSPGWLDAYEAGIFTEFQEQRAPGHTVLGDKIFKKGMNDLMVELNQGLKNIDKNTRGWKEKKVNWRQ